MAPVVDFQVDTDKDQLVHEIDRVTGIIKVNYPVLYASLYCHPQFVSREQNDFSDESMFLYLDFLNKELNDFKLSRRN